MSNKKKLRLEINRARRIDFWRGIMLGMTGLLLCIGIFGLILQGQSDERAREADRTANEAVNEKTDLVLTKIENVGKAQVEQGENILCVLALLNPEKFPSADQERCRTRLAGINNQDNTFLSDEVISEFLNTPNPQPTREITPPPNNQPDPFLGLCVLGLPCLEVK